MSIPSVHHNPDIWGPDHNSFVPDRWLKGDPAVKDLSAFLIPFSTGHRSCIGRNIAQTSIFKLMAAVFRNYVIELVDPEEKLVMISLGISEKKGPLLCKVRKRT
jgi:benzoate 4-monooxygenase